MKQYLVYVDVPVVSTGKLALFVTDVDDLNSKLTKHEENFRKQQLIFKPRRDEKGKIVLHPLNSDWDLND